MRATVVVPTHNEAGAIEMLIETLFREVFPLARGWLLSLVVVDGHSTDRTADIVRRCTNRFDRLFLIEEPSKEGIGAAYVKGFSYAIESLGADVVIELDGDLQHPPSAVLDLLRKIEEGFDYVLGSRRVNGGGYPKAWGFRRQLLSRVGGFIARLALFFPFREFFLVTDPTSGLRASRVKGFLDRFDYHRLTTYGFGYKLDLLARMLTQGARYAEIPLRFAKRESGESKLTDQTIGEMLATLFALRVKDRKTVRFARFCLVGLLGFVINAVMLEVFRRLDLTLSIPESAVGRALAQVLLFTREKSAWAAALAAEVAVVTNFCLHNSWTFQRRHGETPTLGRTLLRFALFNVTSFGAIVIQFVCVGLAVLFLGDAFAIRQIALIGSVLLLVVPYNWTMYNVVIWRRRLLTATSAKELPDRQ